jgi:thiol-disulfide isomerase/thioredoxin
VKRLAVALLSGLLLLAGGCTGPAESAAAGAPVAGPAGTGPARATTGWLAFTGETLDGEFFDASTLAGKPALLWFWAPWCATCAAQAGSVIDLKDTYGDRLSIVGVAGLGSTEEMHEFVDDLEIAGIRNLDDEAGAVWRKFGITQQSSYVLITEAGKVAGKGYLDDQQLTAAVTRLVG